MLGRGNQTDVRKVLSDLLLIIKQREELIEGDSESTMISVTVMDEVINDSCSYVCKPYGQIFKTKIIAIIVTGPACVVQKNQQLLLKSASRTFG